MGKIRENMEQLVNEVRSSAGARHRGVAGVRFAARDLLAQDRREGGERRQTLGLKARALSTRLAYERKVQLGSARELKTGLGRATERRRAAVQEGCAAVRHRLEHLHGARERHAAKTRKLVRGEVAEIRAAVGELRGSVQAAMGAMAKDMAEAGRLWRTTGSARRY